MNRHPLLAPAAPAALAALLAAALPAQEDPPPWWGIQDNDTVSLGWNFDNQAAPLLPTVQIAPAWFTAATFTNSPNVTWLPNLAGHQGVLGFTGPGTATISLLVDNDPRPFWNKVFWFQFDEHESSSGKVSAAIRQDLTRYKRANITEKTVALGNNWYRTTIDALLIPQPIDEDIDFTLTDNAVATAAIDNLFVNSKCIKPWRDETGDALGQPEGTVNVDLLAATANPDCLGVAATENQLGVRRFWVSGRSTGAATPHLLYQISGAGQLQATFAQPLSPVTSQSGMSDLTVVVDPAGTFIYGLALQAAAASPPLLLAFDEQTGAFDPARTITLSALPPGTLPVGLTYFPHGGRGSGTFVVTDPAAGLAHEIARNGQLLRSFPTGAPGVTGAGYDAATGMFYWFGTGGSQDPRNIQVVGTEFSAYDDQPTGVHFYGNLAVAPGPGGSPGGVAQGMEVVRLRNGNMRLVCVARGARPVLYELRGPFRYGHSLLGRIGVSGGPSYRGNTGFRITLDGVPNATFATLYLGFSNQSHLGTPLPFYLSGLGMPESAVSVALDIHVVSRPVVNGSAFHGISLPGSPIWSYQPTFWQWVLFDPTAPNGFTLSQAGKTVLY